MIQQETPSDTAKPCACRSLSPPPSQEHKKQDSLKIEHYRSKYPCADKRPLASNAYYNAESKKKHNRRDSSPLGKHKIDKERLPFCAP